MKTLITVICAHVAGLAVLFAIGWSLNDVIHEKADKYAGLITVFSTAFGIYSFVISVLYNRNRQFYFWINRLRLMFSRTHTYWQPSFDLELAQNVGAIRPPLLEQICEALKQGSFGRVTVGATTPTSLAIEIDNVMGLMFRVDGNHLHMHLDRKLLVPSHLYDAYRHKLSRIVEGVNRVAMPVEIRYGVIVSFGDGVPNPYYGFFVNQVPQELLQDFHVTFRPDEASTCRIEAGTNHVSVEGSSHADVFEGLSQVLKLRAIPGGNA